MVIPKNIEETMAKYKKIDLKQSLLLAIRFQSKSPRNICPCLELHRWQPA